MPKARIVVVMLCVGCLSVARADAQSSSGLVNQMHDLFVQSVVLSRTPAGSGVVAHTPVFLNDPNVTATTELISQVSEEVGSQLSIFPLGSSSGGFTYGYDPVLGTFSRTTETFGPAFAERAATVGKGKVSFGMNFIHAKYTSIDGKDLEGGALKFDLLHQALDPRSYVEGDVIQAELKMKLTSNTTAFLLNYGVTDRLDVGLAVPVVSVNMDVTYHATILDFATHTFSPTTHLFGNGSKTEDFTSQGSASGVGDVVLRGKYSFSSAGARGVGIGLDLRLPTGDQENMLGSGTTQTKLFIVGSSVVGEKLSPHVNVGYTLSKGGTLEDQINYVGGVEYGATPRVTIVGDLIGRTLRNTLRLTEQSTEHLYQQGPTAPIEKTTLDSVGVKNGNLTSALAAIGVKLNPVGNLLISGHLLLPLNHAGLRSSVTPVIGFDYAF